MLISNYLSHCAHCRYIYRGLSVTHSNWKWPTSLSTKPVSTSRVAMHETCALFLVHTVDVRHRHAVLLSRRIFAECSSSSPARRVPAAVPTTNNKMLRRTIYGDMISFRDRDNNMCKRILQISSGVEDHGNRLTRACTITWCQVGTNWS